jgi:thiamine biosynthesis lipoprotein
VQLHRFDFKAMGSPCELRLYAGSRAEAERVAEEARSEVCRLEQKYSRYRDDSVTSEINASAGDPAGLQVDEETASLLDYAETLWEQSEGLFDITSGILRRAWDFRSGRLPRAEEVDALRSKIGWGEVSWRRPRLTLPREGMELDFGGYVKEYAADRTAELCRRLGLRHGLVDLGGDLSVVGPHPDGSAWRVGIRDPRRPDKAMAMVPVRAGGVATSGDYERYMIVAGKRYGHILSPHTGWPVEDALAAVSVVASHCLLAGTATTIALLKGPKGAAWLDELGLASIRVDQQGRISGQLASPSGSPARSCDRL